MDIEERYQKPTIDYYASIIWRKVMTNILAYPEFIFLAKIIGGLLVALIVFTFIRKFFGG